MENKLLKLANYYSKTNQTKKSSLIYELMAKNSSANYLDFIKKNVKDPKDSCFFYSAILNIEFPELKLIEGEPILPERGETAHFWLEDEDGNIIDPTKSQYDGDICYRKIREVDVTENLYWVVNSPKFDELKSKIKKKIIKLIKEKSDSFDKKLEFKKADRYSELLIKASFYKYSKLSTLDPEFQTVVSSVMSKLASLGWKPRVASGRRTISEQIGKFSKGYSVGFGTGSHYMGMAADVIDTRYGWNIKGDHPFWQDLGRIAQEHGLVWGGIWKHLYPPHGDVAHIQFPHKIVAEKEKNNKIQILQDSLDASGISVEKTGELDQQTEVAWNKLKSILQQKSQGKIILPELSNENIMIGAKYAQYLAMIQKAEINKHTRKNIGKVSLRFGKDVSSLWEDEGIKDSIRKSEKIYAIQNMLKQKGFSQDKPDGVWGPKTEKSWLSFKQENPSQENEVIEKELKALASIDPKRKEFIKIIENYWGNPYYLYTKPIPNSEDFIIYATEKGEPVMEATIIKDRGVFVMDRVRILNVYSSLREEIFRDNILNWLKQYKLSYKMDPPPHKFINVEFSDKEKEMFKDAEDILKNMPQHQPIGKGFFRLVYNLGDYVLKVARKRDNYDTRAINKSEAQSRLHQDFPDLTAKVLKHAPDFSWIIQEKAIPLNRDRDLIELIPELKFFSGSEFDVSQEIADLIFNSISLLGSSYKGTHEGDEIRDYEEIKRNFAEFKTLSPILQKITLMCIKYGVDIEDFKAKNLGFVNRDGAKHLVLFDIGTHYSTKPEARFKDVD